MKNQKMLTLWGLWIAVALTALALTSATFAWFTANREVETEKVTARSGSTNLELHRLPGTADQPHRTRPLHPGSRK